MLKYRVFYLAILAYFPGREPFVTSKIICGLIGLLALCYSRCRSALDVIIITSVGWQAISLSQSAHPLVGLIGWPNDHTTGLSSMIFCALIYSLVGQKSKTKIITWTATAAAAIALVQIVASQYGYLTRYVLDGRPAGPSGGPTYLGMLLAMCLPAALSTGSRAAVALIIAGLIAAGSAGAWLGAAAGVAWYCKERVTRRAALVAALAVGLGAWVYAGRSDPWRSQAGRWEAWRAAGAVARAHPLYGVGPSQFQVLAPANGPGKYHRHAHNDILEAAATTGIPGAILLIAFWCAAIWRHRGTVTGAMLISLCVALKFNPPGVEILMFTAYILRR